MTNKLQMPMLGWREWVALPELTLPLIKAKIDTGARTSALHASDIEYFKRGNKKYVRFTVHPLQRTSKSTKRIVMPYIEMRKIKSSTGSVTTRPVVETKIQIGEILFPIELTLVDRDIMGFRMLLGRQAIRKKFLIDPGKSYLTRKLKKKVAKKTVKKSKATKKTTLKKIKKKK